MINAKEAMKIYHYTSINALEKILSNRTIRFTRLDSVDDKEEEMYSHPVGINPARYFFVSCWSKEAEESIPMWREYADGARGVRIGLDENMFETFKINERFNSFFKVPFDYSQGYIKTFINDASLIDLVYLAHPEEERAKCVQLDGKGFRWDNNIGQYKRSCWAYQKESRFKLLLLPIDTGTIIKNPPKSVREYMEFGLEAMNKAIVKGVNLPIGNYDVPLQHDKLDRIEVLLGPLTSRSEENRVKEMLKGYPCACIGKSKLEIRQ